MNRKYIFMMILGFFILYPATAWLMMLSDVLRWGSRLLFEPNLSILYLEFGITIVSFFATIFLIFWFYLKALKGEN